MHDNHCNHNHENQDGRPESGQAKPCPNHSAQVLLKKLLAILIVVLIIFFAIWSVGSIVDSKLKSKQAKTIQSQRTITVSAEGKVITAPDLATINFSVLTESKTAKEAQTKNTEKMNSVIEYLKSIGIESKDIKTTSYYLYPKYEYPNGRSILVGYTLTNSVNIKTKKFDLIGEIISKSVELGINQVGDVQFSIENPDDLKAEAGEIAMKNAKEKASRLATQAGVSLGKIITFSESDTGNYPMPYYMKAEVMDGMGGGAPAPQIEQGSQEIRMVANITFEIK